MRGVLTKLNYAPKYVSVSVPFPLGRDIFINHEPNAGTF